eukprot:TRINITY_DN7824_c2_g1_i1.p1 TRINITY_DN7824_c2_g1~~TRINITY_DN7824_c2_g1_i1.p1  ORF type:complete len:530 (-),score=92.55 TRINITY_DN7824_c2_g1_i1:3-1592(-)
MNGAPIRIMVNPPGYDPKKPPVIIDTNGIDDLTRKLGEAFAFHSQESSEGEVPLSAAEAKAKGNETFARGEYGEAEMWYTKAIERDAQNAILYSNRSAARFHLKKYSDSLSDAQRATDLHPAWPKGWGRMGAACRALKQYDKAIIAYEKALQLDPSNATLKQDLQNARLDASSSSSSSPAPSSSSSSSSPSSSPSPSWMNVKTMAHERTPVMRAIAEYEKKGQLEAGTTGRVLYETYIWWDRGLRKQLQSQEASVDSLEYLFNALVKEARSCYLPDHPGPKNLILLLVDLIKVPKDDTETAKQVMLCSVLGHIYFLSQNYVEAAKRFQQALDLVLKYMKAHPEDVKRDFPIVKFMSVSDSSEFHWMGPRILPFLYYNIGVSMDGEMILNPSRSVFREEECIATLKKVLQHDPHHLFTHTQLGKMYGRIYNAKEAVKHYDVVLKLAPDDDEMKAGGSYAHCVCAMAGGLGRWLSVGELRRMIRSSEALDEKQKRWFGPITGSPSKSSLIDAKKQTAHLPDSVIMKDVGMD